MVLTDNVHPLVLCVFVVGHGHRNLPVGGHSKTNHQVEETAEK